MTLEQALAGQGAKSQPILDHNRCFRRKPILPG